jgi:hypothetical protein
VILLVIFPSSFLKKRVCYTIPCLGKFPIYKKMENEEASFIEIHNMVREVGHANKIDKRSC